MLADGAHVPVHLVLASASPRRSALLRAAGVGFVVAASAVEELHDGAMTPRELTICNARRKAEDISAGDPEALVLGADTLVYVDGEPLGKPSDLAEAAAMLRRLSGRTHDVCTGIVLARGGAMLAADAVVTRVRFGVLDDAAIARYHGLVDPLDKAGGYGIQEFQELLGAVVDGPLDNVIGLPVAAVLALLDEVRVSRPDACRE